MTVVDREVRRACSLLAQEIVLTHVSDAHGGDVPPDFYAFLVSSVARQLEGSVEDIELLSLQEWLGEMAA